MYGNYRKKYSVSEYEIKSVLAVIEKKNRYTYQILTKQNKYDIFYLNNFPENNCLL